ncbi:MAG: baseplate J/gp47 family protein [Thermosipho sp. (in: Bacteria)]|nr:baseplate J/gp47 family protein [Thermosipho sp. (in: thermotogales)]
MKSKSKHIDFVTKDYEGFRQLMIDAIPKYLPEWTDRSQSDFGIVLIELFAYGLDILSYYQDKAINENLLSTAQIRESVVNLARFLGYEATPQTPAKVMVQFTKYSDLLNQDVVIPAGTKVSTSDGKIIFETDSELTIPSGQLSAQISCTHGVTYSNDVIGKSDGSENQVFKLTQPNVLLDTVSIYTQDSDGTLEKWDRVDNFLNSTVDDKHYRLYEIGEFTYVEFSNGNSGMIPPVDVKIVASYRVGGGEEGNVGANTLVRLYDDYIDGIESVTNPSSPYELGKEKESIESIRLNAPKAFRTNLRAVTKQDFEDIATSLDGVAKAKLEELFDFERNVNLYIVPDTYDTPTQKLKDYVKTEIEKVMLVNTNLNVLDPTYVDFDLTLDLVVEDNYVRDDVANNLKTLIEEEFNIQYMDFGENIKLKDILALTRDVEGIEDLTVTSTLPTVTEYEILRLNTVTINATGGVVIGQ